MAEMSEHKQRISSYLVQDYLEAILENFHDGIYITDKDANTVYINHSYEVISGLLKSEMLGKNMKDLVDKRMVSKSGTLEVLKTGKSVTMEQRFYTGKRAIITSHPIYEENSQKKNIIMIVTIVREITEIYFIRKELQRQEQLNRKYFYELERIRKEMNGNVEIVAVDKKSISLMRLVNKISLMDSPVLLSGELGTGKEKIASYIHNHSKRTGCSFVRVNFSIIPKEKQFEQLFGYEDGDLGEYHMGILESAEGGTVYLEEIADMPLELQSYFLRMLQDGTCVMGDGAFGKFNVRIIAGSKYTLEELEVKSSVNFEILREFALFPLKLDPLRERKDDIVPLVDFFLNQYNKKSGEKKQLDRESYIRLMNYEWPGNVRELKNLVQRAIIISPTDVISDEDLFIEDNVEFVQRKQEEIPEKIDMKLEIAKLEADYIVRALRKFKSNRAAAESLGMDNSTFVRKRQRYEQMGLIVKK